MTEHDAAADLAYIRRVMEETRSYTTARGGYFIVWGVAISLGLLGTWLQIDGRLGGSNFLLWTACIVAGWVVTGAMLWREAREPVAPLMARHIGLGWTAIGIAMCLVFFVGVPAGTVPPRALAGLSATLVGTGMFVTAVLAGIGWLRWVAAGWWLGAAYMLAFPDLRVLLVMALLLFFLQIVPGIVLVRQGRAARG